MENSNQTGSSSLDQENDDNKPISESRPLSYYDNGTIRNGSMSSNNNLSKESKSDKSPTQMHCLTTTVPQNIAGLDISGKHTPTRNSLRHSRMIVLNRNGTAPIKADFLKYYKYIKSLLVLILLFGTILCILSLLLLLWTPNIKASDNTYWSAIPVIFSGIIAFIFLRAFPRKRSANHISLWVALIRFLSILTSLIAAVASFTMCGYTILHLLALASMTCSPADKVNTTCLCKRNSTEHSSFESYHYVDLSCSEVNNILYVIIIFMCVTNALVGIFEMAYLFLLWSAQTVYTYSRIHTNDNSTPLRGIR